jgi:hypothetical protein
MLFLVITRIVAKKRTITIGNHRGESTHHQDHVIYPVSFRVIKIRVRIDRNGKVFFAELV